MELEQALGIILVFFVVAITFIWIHEAKREFYLKATGIDIDEEGIL